MKLTETEQTKLSQIITCRYKSILRELEFSPAFQAGRLSIDDITTVYQKTLRAIENKSFLSSFERFASHVATKEIRRYIRSVLAEERERSEKHLSLNDTILQTSRVRLGPISVDPAALVEERDLHARVRALVDRLPPTEATLVRAWMTSSHGDRAIDAVAQQLRISHATAYNLFRTARDQLRARLSDMDAH